MAANPHVQGWREWDERYADLVLGKRNWQITAAGVTAITLVLAVAMVWVSTRSKFVPYVVEVDKLGYALDASSAIAGCSGKGFGMKARLTGRLVDVTSGASAGNPIRLGSGLYGAGRNFRHRK